MKKIGVLQIDGKIPNLALMEIAGYYEAKGYEVEHYKGQLFDDEYEHVFASKLFSFSDTPYLPPGKHSLGGTGIDFYNKLPKEILDFKAPVSYNIYPNCNYHLGFSMKGCRFNCKFCCVPKKEGRPSDYNTIDEILINPNGSDRLMLLDNDFFGGSWRENLNRINELKLKVCFVQGLNIRIITDEQAEMLAITKFRGTNFKEKYLTFAWDKFKDEKIILSGIERCVKAGLKANKMQFFVLIGFDTTKQQDLHRLYILKQLGCVPYAMPYNKKDPYQRDMCNYVNGFGRKIFYKHTFDEYLEMKKRQHIKSVHESQIKLF